MSQDLSIFIDKMREYSPFGEKIIPNGLKFILDFPKFVKVLENINNLIGLHEFKLQILKQFRSFIVNYRRFGKPTSGEKLHTLLYGPPGSGKSQLGKYLAELWAYGGCLYVNDKISIKLPQESNILNNQLMIKDIRIQENNTKLNDINSNINKSIALLNNIRAKTIPKNIKDQKYINQKNNELKKRLKKCRTEIIDSGLKLFPLIIPRPKYSETISKPKFSILTRGDLIGKFQGHTTDQFRKILNEHIGGVIMIDEAYNLSTSQHDDYGKELLTEINNFMTTWSDKIAFIFAGYREEMEESIFKIQPGLARRFNWIFDITNYTSDELHQIFLCQLRNLSLSLNPNTLEMCKLFFKNNYTKFPHFGGDTERLCVFVQESCYNNLWEHALDESLPQSTYLDMFTDININHLLDGFTKYLMNSIKEKQSIDKTKQENDDNIKISSYIT